MFSFEATNSFVMPWIEYDWNSTYTDQNWRENRTNDKSDAPKEDEETESVDKFRVPNIEPRNWTQNVQVILKWIPNILLMVEMKNRRFNLGIPPRIEDKKERCKKRPQAQDKSSA
jgi:hypothetical protein